MKTPRILFFGTPKFAISSLEALIKNNYEVVGVITTPDEPAGRKNILTAPPIKQVAETYALPIYQPSKIEKDYWNSHIPEADIYIVVAYGKILPAWLLDKPKHGVLNIHPSLLPKYRGPSPIQGALLSNETKTGVSIMLMDQEVDHGPILSQQELLIEPKDDAISLSSKLATLGAGLLIDTLPKWIANTAQPKTQNHEAATYTKIIHKEDGRIDWKQPAQEIINQIRAYALWPQCWSILENQNKQSRIKILTAKTTTTPSSKKAPGTTMTQDNKLFVVAKDFILQIELLQPESRTAMSAEEFLRGTQISKDAKFI